MLSRVAESSYWMARYVERAENTARLIHVNLNLNLDMPGGQEQWSPLVSITAGWPKFNDKYGEATRENVIEYMAFDTDNPNSILSSLIGARENARSIREAISTEMWEQINVFYLMVRDGGARQRVQYEPLSFFNEVVTASHTFIGVTDATMTHNESWHFSRLGRLMERADQTSRIVDVKYFVLLPNLDDIGSPLDDIQWAALLRSASGFTMYRQKYGRIKPENVVQFLVLDREFPRSTLWCVTKARESLHAISGTPAGMFRNPAEQRMGQLYGDLAYAGVESIFSTGLHEFLDDLQRRLNLVGDAVFDTFFAMRPVTGAVQYQ